MDSEVGAVIETLAQRGFARLQGALSTSIVERLQSAADRTSARPLESWSGAALWNARAEWRTAHFGGAGRNTNLYDCLGIDSELDETVEELLATPRVRELLDRVLGADRRMWYVQFRWAEPGAEQYVLHQDVYGELALAVYLSEHTDERGSMALWPGSHRWPRALEALPLLEPRWVAGRVRSVPGAVGDICVFFNKTWHGRTSARERRLVFLISFFPPGPVEKGRRVPESVRARLGPELRRVTAPRMGRTFGAQPPAATPFSATFEVPHVSDPACTFHRHAERSIAAYAWACCRAQAGPGASTADLLRAYQRILAQAVRFPVALEAALDALCDDFRAHGAALGLARRAYFGLQLHYALWNGRLDAAHAAFEAWSQLRRDEVCGPAARDVALRMRYHIACGQDGPAIAERAALSGDPSHEPSPEEGTARSLLMLPLLRLGRADEAAEAHAGGYASVTRRADCIPAIGRHLEYLARLADPTPALELVRDNLVMVASERCGGASWHFWRGHWLLFDRLARAGRATVETVSPWTGEYASLGARDLADHARARVEHFARAFDRRNGNDYRARCLVEWRALVAGAAPERQPGSAPPISDQPGAS